MQIPKFKPVDEVSSVLRANRSIFVATGIFSGIVNILMLTGSIFMLQIYDRVITSGSVPTLVALSLIALALYAYYGVLDFIRSRLMVRIGRRVEENLRERAFDAIAVHALRRTPNVGVSPMADVSTVRNFLSGQGPFAFLDMPWVPVYILVIWLVHWQLGLASAIAAVIVFVLALLTDRATRKPIAEANIAGIKSSLLLEEARRNTEALHTLGMRKTMRDRWVDVQGSAMNSQTQAADVGGGIGAVSRVFRMVVQSAILAIGAYLVIKLEITAGAMVACSIIAGRALAPVDQAVGSWQGFLMFRKASERLSKALESVPVAGKKLQLPPPIGKLEAEGLAVKAPSGDKVLLQGISFTVTPGQGLGIIGPTGAGKSTLARALVGVTPLAAGRVRLDGATFDQRDVDENGRYIGYLPQEVQLFDGTASENISRFDPEAKDEVVVAAAKMAKIHDFIMRLPNGYNTPLGEQGARLSAGQRQRLALARALYGNPAVLILDEPNSNLDVEGEMALDNAIRISLERGAAVIVIAHRPSALASLHRIMILNNGQIMAFGPRDEIMKKLQQPRPAPNAPIAVAPQQPVAHQMRVPQDKVN
jgi:ATP-binding cassette subfamily C protein